MRAPRLFATEPRHAVCARDEAHRFAGAARLPRALEHVLLRFQPETLHTEDTLEPSTYYLERVPWNLAHC